MAARSTKKKTNTKRNTKKTQADSTVRDEIMILITLAFCILMLISNFGVGGTVGSVVSAALFGIFGFTAYAVPFVLFGGIAFYASNKGNSRAYIKLGAGIVFVVLFCTFLELIMNSYDKNASLLSYYTQASLHKNAGGLVGGCLVKLMCPLIGVAGTYVLIIILAIICVVLITEKSFLGFVKNGGSKAYEDAKKRKEISDKKRAERRQAGEIKKKNRASGVSFDTTLKKKSPELKELVPPETGANEPVLSQDAAFEDFVITRPEPVVDAAVQEPAKPAAPKEKKTQSNAQEVENEAAIVEDTIRAREEKPKKAYKCPPISLLMKGKKSGGDSDAHLRATALKLEQTLHNFGVNVRVTNASCGPSVTRYELQPEQGVKVSKIVGLADDIKLNLAVADLRIEAPIPGKAAVGIEVPNKENSAVMLRDLLESNEFKRSKSNIAFAAGKDISGKTVIADIAKMPHLLVAGATGSGKSVCINTLIMSILYEASPEDVKLIMIDPKVVELSVYNGIPHLLIPVVTDPKKAAGALNWAVAEMTKRYQLFAEYNVRDLNGFNDKIADQKGEENGPKKMPQIVIIVDELADLMMVAPGEVEGAICRLAQLARAAGLHLVLATQRPSVNVITGLIKANMPSRIAFSVSSGVDSRTIIDMNGAEKLLGKGDMLFYPAGYPKPVRVQGSFVSDQEVQKVVEYLIDHNGNADYSEEVTNHVNSSASGAAGQAGPAGDGDSRDAYFADAGKFIIEKDKASIGMLQRVFKIGFNRAARIMDQLAEAGVVGEEEGTKPRKVLMTMEEFEQYIEEYV